VTDWGRVMRWMLNVSEPKKGQRGNAVRGRTQLTVTRTQHNKSNTDKKATTKGGNTKKPTKTGKASNRNTHTPRTSSSTRSCTGCSQRGWHAGSAWRCPLRGCRPPPRGLWQQKSGAKGDHEY
jgi:hypothetical protein